MKTIEECEDWIQYLNEEIYLLEKKIMKLKGEEIEIKA